MTTVIGTPLRITAVRQWTSSAKVWWRCRGCGQRGSTWSYDPDALAFCHGQLEVVGRAHAKYCGTGPWEDQ